MGKTSFTKAPNLIYMFHEGQHHTPATLVLTMHCFRPHWYSQGIPDVPGPFCNESGANATKLLQKNSSVDSRWDRLWKGKIVVGDLEQLIT